MDLGNQQVTLTCPGCQHQFEQVLARLQQNPTIDCPGCKQPINIDARQFNAAMQEVDQQIADLGAALGGIRKR